MNTRSDKMRKNILFLLIISLFICFSSNSLLKAASKEVREAGSNTVIPFFYALMSGDVDGMKKYISKEYYDKNRALLDENTEYPGFLMEYYQGATFQISHINMVDGNIIVEVEILFPNETRGDYVVYLKQEEDVWKIQEINELTLDEFKKRRKPNPPNR